MSILIAAESFYNFFSVVFSLTLLYGFQFIAYSIRIDERTVSFAVQHRQDPEEIQSGDVAGITQTSVGSFAVYVVSGTVPVHFPFFGERPMTFLKHFPK